MAQKDEVQFSRENPEKEVAIKPDFITERLSLILKICWLFWMVTANDLWNEKFFPNPVSFSINVLHDVLFASCLNSAALKIFSNINVHFNSLLWSLFWYLAFMICLHSSTISGAISWKVTFSPGFTWRHLNYSVPPSPHLSPAPHPHQSHQILFIFFSLMKNIITVSSCAYSVPWGED